MRWEYMVTQLAGADFCDALAGWLNELGQKGWELATICPVSTVKGMDYWVVFKRPVLDSVVVQGSTDTDLAKAVESLANGMEKEIFGA